MATARILIIDDEPATLFAFKRLLTEPITNVDTAATLVEALKLLNERIYQAVLADLRLSSSSAMEGYEIIKHSKQIQPNARVIVVTAYGDEAEKAKVLSMGADSYMEKPVSPTAIRSILRNLGTI